MALQNNKGFTLAELMVAMGLSAIVMASVGYVYYTQQKTYLAQEQIAGAQQNLRAVLYFMEREIRMAGYDPTRSGNFQIQTANTNTITMRIDLNGNGVLDADETITYSLDAANNQLERNGQPLAENIDALDFRYLPAPSPPAALVPLDDDGMGNVVASIPLIRSVQATVVAGTERADPGYTDTRDYPNLQGTTILAAPNDNFRRRFLSTTIRCRNL